MVKQSNNIILELVEYLEYLHFSENLINYDNLELSQFLIESWDNFEYCDNSKSLVDESVELFKQRNNL